MDKSSNQISGVSPVGKVSPVMAVASIGDAVQALESRASTLAKQHAGLAGKTGVLTLTQTTQQATSTADVSAAAKLIDQSIKLAEANGLSAKYIAQTVITQTPKFPHLVSEQLKAAISNSGLFYESHLREFIDGQRQLGSIKLEPQNLQHQIAQALLPQQLHILEHQRFTWFGEVWPNQKMDWDVYAKKQEEKKDLSEKQTPNATTSIASDLTLHLPNLGKVTAKISIQNGRMHIGLFAEQETALQLLKEESLSLVDAVERNRIKLEGLTLSTFHGKGCDDTL